MKTHNVTIYHCLCCGRVVHSEPEAEVPQCCGQEMARAGAEAAGESEGGPHVDTVDRPAKVPPVIRARPESQ